AETTRGIIAEKAREYHAAGPGIARKNGPLTARRLLLILGAPVTTLRAVGIAGRHATAAIITGMFRLTREVRFAVNHCPDSQLREAPANGYAGFPSLTGLGHYFAVRVTIGGSLDPQSQYLQNIKLIDTVVRDRCISVIETAVRDGQFSGGAELLRRLFD